MKYKMSLKHFAKHFISMAVTAAVLTAVTFADCNRIVFSNTVVYAETEENEAPKSGVCGDNVSWVIDSDGLLTISGSGAMHDYKNSVIEGAPWRDYRQGVKSVKIESGVTCIGKYAFLYCSNITSVEIPDTVTVIGDYAFNSCTNLVSLSLPDSITEIGENAFYRCYGLETINIPKNITQIANGTFYSCAKLSPTIEIPSGVTHIGENAFWECKSLKSIKIPNTVTDIGESAFGWCESLEYFEIPDSVEVLHNNNIWMFYQDYAIKTLIYPERFAADNYLATNNTTKIRYQTNENKTEIEITYIKIGYSKPLAEIPNKMTIGGVEYTVTGVAESYRSNVSKDGHTHIEESAAKCTQTAVCAICGEYGDMLEHTWDGGTVTTVPTEEAEGEKTYTCTNCGTTKTEPIAKLGVAINEINFPDDIFRQYVSDECDIDHDGFLSDEEIGQITKIIVTNSGVQSLNGIEYLTSLENLSCASNRLTSIDVSRNTALSVLDCRKNNLISLDTSSNTALSELICSYNNLTSLDLSRNTALSELYCYNNNLTSLDISNNTLLKYLDCNFNQLTSLDVSKNTALIILDCDSNQLTSLDVGNNTALTVLHCDGNRYNIGETCGAYDLKNLPVGFDLTKASNWQGATLESDMLTGIDGNGFIRYDYDCGNNHTATFYLPYDYIEHIYDDGVITIEPTEDTEGEKTCTCTNCGATKIEPIAKLEHVHNQVTELLSNATGHWYACSDCDEKLDFAAHTEDDGTVTVEPTETTEGQKVYKCTVCGYTTRTETVEKLEHVHNQRAELMSDATGHWYTCSGCDEKLDFATHTEDSGTVTVEPTETTNGQKVYKCTVCGYTTRTETVANLGHVHNQGTELLSNATGHWYACSDCDEKLDFAAHTENDGTVTVEPTETTEGQKVYKCMVCSYTTRTETVAKLEHVHNQGAELMSDATGHWYTCSGCDEKLDFATHTEDSGTVTVEPTINTEGQKVYKCAVCGYVTRTENILAVTPNHTHSFDNYWKSDNTSHWHECNCGVTSDVANHISDSGKVTVQPTATLSGIRTYSCSVCGYLINTETIPATGNNNSTSSPTYPSVTPSTTVIPTNSTTSTTFNVKVDNRVTGENGKVKATRTGENVTINLGKDNNGYYANAYTSDGKVFEAVRITSGKAKFIIQSDVDFYIVIDKDSHLEYEDVSSDAGATDSGSPIDVASPVTNGVRIPQADLPRGFRVSNKKRRYRVLRKRRLDDLVFVF